MATKLAIKHKNSLVLKKSTLLHKDKCETRERSKLKKCGHLSLPCLMLSMFSAYWFVLCPLIWAACYVSTNWPSFWSSSFWIVAFLVWIMIICGLIISWRYLQVEQNYEIKVIPRYRGSDNVAEKSMSTHQMTVSIEKSPGTNNINDISDRIVLGSKNDQGNSRRRDLPPLVIHKRMSGEKIEDIGIVHVEKDEQSPLNISSDYIRKSPLQDYLKLMTMSLSENEIKSPNVATPMSPRELFFIDLIREAEKAESAQSLKTRRRFFPKEEIENGTGIIKDVKGQGNENDIKDKKDIKDERNKETINGTSGKEMCLENNKKDSKDESCYFIADVENPINKKTEMFLQVDTSR